MKKRLDLVHENRLRLQNQNPIKFFRISDEYLKTSDWKNEQLLSRSLLKGQEFIYIDMSDEKGFKVMREVEESDSDQQIQKLGNNYISNLQDLSYPNTKTVAYLFQSKQETQKKKDTLQMMSEQLQRSRDKMKKYGTLSVDKAAIYGKNQEQMKTHVYRGMDDQLIQQIKEKEQYQQLSKILKERQENLLAHYETISTHRPRKMKIEKKSKEMKLNTFLPILNR